MRLLGLLILTGSIALAYAGQPAAAPQAQQTARPEPPTRDPHSPGYVHAKELPDGTVPPADQDGNFIIGPTHSPASEMTAQDLTHGSVVEFTMSSADSKYYPGIAREKGTLVRLLRMIRQSWWLRQVVPLRIRARFRCMSQRSMFRAAWSRSLWARMGRIECFSLRWMA